MAMSRFGVLGLALAGSLVGSLAVSGAALADGPGYSIKDTPVEAPFRWTGPYIGFNIGYDDVASRQIGTPQGSYFNNTSVVLGAAVVTIPGCTTAGACPNSFGNNSTGGGAIGGLQTGYNLQSSNFVYGVEFDLQGTTAGARHDIDLNPNGAFVPFHGAEKTNVSYIATLRARFGLLFTPTLLGYVTGGLAAGGVERSFGGSFKNGDIYTGRSGTIDTGWAAGAGLEWAFDKKSTLGFEYMYVELDGGDRYLTSSQSGACVAAATPICTVSVKGGSVENNIFRLKYNYRF